MTNLHVFPTIKLIKIEVEQQSNSITSELIKIIILLVFYAVIKVTSQ